MKGITLTAHERGSVTEQVICRASTQETGFVSHSSVFILNNLELISVTV